MPKFCVIKRSKFTLFFPDIKSYKALKFLKRPPCNLIPLSLKGHVQSHTPLMILIIGLPVDQAKNEVEADDAEYDLSSDEEAGDISLSSQPVIQGEIGSSAHFLLGVRSRFGRVFQ